MQMYFAFGQFTYEEQNIEIRDHISFAAISHCDDQLRITSNSYGF
jgi:hypothetical protein